MTGDEGASTLISPHPSSSLLIYFSTPGKDFILYQGDSLELLPQFEEASFDLIFADPPYFLSNGGMTCHSGKRALVDKGSWDVPRSVEENHDFNLRWLSACRRLLKPDGTLWVSGTMHVIFSIGHALQQLGYKLLNDVIWYKPNAPPNLSCRYFTHSTERIIWAAKDAKSKHRFNDKLMRADNNGKQMRNFWGDVWSLTSPKSREKKSGKHPTQKPVELLQRILLASSREGDLVLDPFQGSGTTGLVARELKRRYVGIEKEAEYLDLTKRRLREAERGTDKGIHELTHHG